MKDYIDWKRSQPFSIPGFSRQEEREGRGLVPTPYGITVKQWYQDFVHRVFEAADKGSYLPIFRASDGEFTFVLGRSFAGMSFRDKTINIGRHTYNSIKFLSPFYSSGRRGYVETYPFWQLHKLRRQFATELKIIASHGCICFNFSNSSLSSPYSLRFVDWLTQVGVELNQSNFFHFYFVYGLLLGPLGHKLISGHKIAVFTSNIESRSTRILAQLEQMGASDVAFYETSLNQPMKDRLNLKLLEFQPDICLVGAGVGAANILVQLQSLHCLCIDAGFVLDVLGNDELRIRRPYCTPDHLWDKYFANTN